MNLYSSGASIYRREAWEASPGGGCQKQFRELRRRRPLLPGGRWVCSLCPGPQLEAWTDDFANPGGSSAEHPKPPPADLPGPALQEKCSLRPLGRQSLAPDTTTGGWVQPSTPSLPHAPCSWAPGRSSSHSSSPSFGIGHAARKGQGPPDTLPGSTRVSGDLGRPCPHIAPRRAPAHPLNRPHGSPCPSRAGRSGFGLVRPLNFIRIKPGRLPRAP